MSNQTTVNRCNASPSEYRAELVEAFLACAKLHLEELKNAYMEGGMDALQDAYRIDNGMGYVLEGDAVTFTLCVRGAESANETYICELAGDVIAKMQDFEDSPAFLDKAEELGVDASLCAADIRKALLANGFWDYFDFSETPVEVAIKDELETAVAFFTR